jgi:hypothetical protein
LNVLSLFVRHPRQPLQHVVIRHVVATKAESKAVARKREETTAALRRVVTENRLANAIAHQQGFEAVRQALLPEADIERKGR